MNIRIIETKNILTKCNLPKADFSANPYVGCMHRCKYCYAEYMTKFTGHSEPWGSFIDIKYWKGIEDPQRYIGKTVVISSVTDPYQPCEAKYKRTRMLLEQLSKIKVNILIITKSDLILRDLDLIKTFPQATVALSINTLDETFRKDMDCASSIEQRINVLKTFHDAGIQTVCFISPIFPEITNPQEIILIVKDKCNEVWLENLNLKGSNKNRIFNYIQLKHNNLYSIYHNIYIKNDTSYWQLLDDNLKLFAETENFNYVPNFQSDVNTNRLTIVNYFFHEQLVKVKSKLPNLIQNKLFN